MIHEITDDFAGEVPAVRGQRLRPRVGRVPGHPRPAARIRRQEQNLAERKRETLTRLYDHDQRVAPWRGTAWGVLQAVNTYAHHEDIIRGAERAERNMLNAVTGRTDDLDRKP